MLSVIGGVGWLTYLYPQLGRQLFPYVATVGIFGAGLLIVWLLVFGVNEQRWKEQSAAELERDPSDPDELAPIAQAVSVRQNRLQTR